MAFSRETAACLARAGWDEHRWVDTTEFERALRAGGYPAHPAALSFLGRFGGLHVEHPHRVPGAMDSFHLDPAIAVERNLPGTVRAFSDRVGAPLCPIGEAHRGYMVLMMDPAGAVYAGLDRLLERVATTGEEAVEALCTGREPSRLPPPAR